MTSVSSTTETQVMPDTTKMTTYHVEWEGRGITMLLPEKTQVSKGMIEEKTANGVRKYQDLVDSPSTIQVPPSGQLTLAITTMQGIKNKVSQTTTMANVSFSLLKANESMDEYLKKLAKNNDVISQTKDSIIFSSKSIQSFMKMTHKVMVVGSVVVDLSIIELRGSNVPILNKIQARK